MLMEFAGKLCWNHRPAEKSSIHAEAWPRLCCYVKDSWPYLERGSLQREWDGRDLLEKGTI